VCIRRSSALLQMAQFPHRGWPFSSRNRSRDRISPDLIDDRPRPRLSSAESKWTAIASSVPAAGRQHPDRSQIPLGVHAGELKLRGDYVHGIAVNIAARVCALAQPMEVLVTRMVKELIGVTALAFADRGVHALKGVAGSWQVYRIY